MCCSTLRTKLPPLNLKEIIFQNFTWPRWMDTVAVVSHLALTISSSLSFYIYFVLYGAKHKVTIVL